MTLFFSGLAIFFAAHLFSALRSRAPGKDIKVRIGYGPYMGLYSLVSLAGFILIVYGFGPARELGVAWSPPTWSRHINILLMLFALILLVAAQLPAGRIKQGAKHPMLLAVKLWALGHLLANGEWNSIILFGSFLAYAVFDRIMVKRRGDIGPGPDASISSTMDLIAIITGVAAWAAILFWLHPVLFGVPVIA